MMTQVYKEFLSDISSGIKDLKEKTWLQMAMASHLRCYFNKHKKEKLSPQDSLKIVREFFETL